MGYPTSIALLLGIMAGIINGSFALPTRHIKTWRFEHIWLNFGFWGFLVLPWVAILLLDPQISQTYKVMPSQTWLIVLAGGFLFGIGQISFVTALTSIGLGLSFVINIGLGTALGVLLPLVTLGADQLFSASGIATLIGIFFIVVGLFMSFIAGHQRDKDLSTKNFSIKKSAYLVGISLAILAGIFSAVQNYTFALTAHVQQLALASGANSLAAAIVIWPPFLACSFIPYSLYMLYLHCKNGSFNVYTTSGLVRNSLCGLAMGSLWFGSLALYSKASLLIGNLGAIVVWPLFMTFIILTSSFWGWRHNEWQSCRPIIKLNAALSILVLIVAVVILACIPGNLTN